MNDAKINDCYNFIDMFWTETLPDYPVLGPGRFLKDYQQTTIVEAYQNEFDYIKDQLQLSPGMKVLDIGCGYGTFLENLQNNNINAKGINISQKQFAYCKKKDLDVELINWKDLPKQFDASFDSLLANSCLEHFVTPQDALQGKETEIYTNFFKKCADLIDPNSESQRLFISFLFQKRSVAPQILLGDYHNHDEYMFFLLNKMYGDGWYPKSYEEIIDCAAPYFDVVHSEDSAYHYLQTFYFVKKYLLKKWTVKKCWKLFTKGIPLMFKDKDFFYRVKYFYHGAWGWQFQGEKPYVGAMNITFKKK